MTALQDIISNLDLISGPSQLQIEKLDDKEVFHLIFKAASQANSVKVIDKLRKLEGIENIEMINEEVAIT